MLDDNTCRLQDVSIGHEALCAHPLYGAIRDMAQLRIFMQHHVFAVWDFMSLIKALQRHITPASIPWVPGEHRDNIRFINELVLEEESDRMMSGEGGYCSHFESYCKAMKEIGADTGSVESFIETLGVSGLDEALQGADIPVVARDFMRFTFDVIRRNQAHQIASVLAYGRELLVPQLFEQLLTAGRVNAHDTPTLHAYLARHIELDRDNHGPMMIRLLESLCAGDESKQTEAAGVAQQALDVRLRFWDGIHAAIH